jgi:hypothetical protein
MDDSIGQDNRDILSAGKTCDTGASTPSMEQMTASVQVNEVNDVKEADAEEPSLETLKNNINSCAHNLTLTIDEYHASGKEIVDDHLHVSDNLR